MVDAERFCLDSMERIVPKGELADDGVTETLPPLNTLSELQEVVLLVIHVMGLGVNMGLYGLFSDEMDIDPGYSHSIAAFKKIKASSIAHIITRSLEVISGGLDETDCTSPRGLELSKLEDEFFELEDDCWRKLATFITEAEN